LGGISPGPEGQEKNKRLRLKHLGEQIPEGGPGKNVWGGSLGETGGGGLKTESGAPEKLWWGKKKLTRDVQQRGGEKVLPGLDNEGQKPKKKKR